MKIPYYPGCTLLRTAKNLSTSLLSAFSKLGIELIEIPGWICCGAVYPNIIDKGYRILLPAYNLIKAGKISEELLVACDLCYHVLKRTSLVLSKNGDLVSEVCRLTNEKLIREVKVLHLLEVLRDRVGLNNLAKKIRVTFSGLKVAPYYGCTLLRPRNEMNVDSPENPRILEEILTCLGCELVDFYLKTDCCGTYLLAFSPEAVLDRSCSILKSAIESGAEAIVTVCPACHFNLDRHQFEALKRNKLPKSIPVFYVTQLLALSLGVEEDLCGFNDHIVDPRPLVRNYYKGVNST